MFKSFFSLGMLILGIHLGMAQDSKWSITVAYPHPIGDNFLADAYTGILDVGVQHRFADLKVVQLGASINGSLLDFTREGFEDVKISAYFIQPRVFGELDIETLSWFRPNLGVGYSIVIFTIAEDSPQVFTTEDSSEDGINVNVGFSIYIIPNLFVHANYDFTRLFDSDSFADDPYNTRLNQIKVGLGYRF